MTSDAYKSMERAFESYLKAAGRKELEQRTKKLSEYVPKVLSKNLGVSVKNIKEKGFEDAYKHIQKEFEEGYKAINENKKRNSNYQPSVSHEDIAYKIDQGVRTSVNNLEDDLMEKGKNIESFYTKRLPSEASQKKPSLDVYDNSRGEVPYWLWDGVFEFDDKEPRS